MANNVANVAAGKPKIVGGVYMAPLGSTLPTNATAALDAAFEALGYVSSDGVRNNGSLSGTAVKAWGGDVIYVASEGRTDEWGLKLMEVLNEVVLELVYGEDNITGTLDANSLKIAVNSGELPAHAFVIDMVLNKKLKRVVIPNGKLQDIAEITYRDTEPIGYDVTINAMSDEDGNSHYEYFGAASTGG